MKLEGKVAIITGSARGIGKAIALLLARKGAKVVVNDIDIEAMQRTVDEIESLGGIAMPIKADVTSLAEMKELVRIARERFRGVHIFVNNAGISRHAPILEIDDEDWDAMMSVNLKGVLNGIRAVAPHMIEQCYGKIVNIASNAGISAFDGRASYGVTKAGVVLLTKAAARELGPHGINVNAVAPGQIMTDLTYTRRTEAEVEALVAYSNRVSAIGRVGQPEDVANAVLFLTCDESSFITGQVIMADGGRMDYM
ncbi:SDR family NAD(P)-dependent oxidoreductase [Chloroflexota bacterium]